MRRNSEMSFFKILNNRCPEIYHGLWNDNVSNFLCRTPLFTSINILIYLPTICILIH